MRVRSYSKTVMKMNRTLHMDLGENSYDIIMERGALDRIGELLDLERKVMIVTDNGVPPEYAAKVSRACFIHECKMLNGEEHHFDRKTGFVCSVIPGEGSKSMEEASWLISKMLEYGFTRKDAVVAVGGGVVGDLAGFVASIYMRGIDFYNIPTTVLSQVDSSIGGKTAVNFNGIKNIVGSFWQPKKVIIDLDLLKTLPHRQIANGLAEAVKMSMTSDKELFELFEKGNIDENMDEIIYRSLLIKKSVVEQDEREAGIRKILNFGHTIGHAIESVEHLSGLYHGECVALGMIPMTHKKIRPRLIQVLEKLHLPTYTDCDCHAIIKAMSHDKKSTEDGRVTAIFVDEIGTYKMREIDPEALGGHLSMLKGESE